jgi:hypothetical protein
MTAPTTVAPAQLTPEQDAALALLANPGSDHPQPPYSLHREQARQAHRRIGKVLVAAGRADLLDSGPMRNLDAVVKDPGEWMLHPADQRALTAVAGAFDIGTLAMTMTLAALLHDGKAKHRTRQVAAGA